MKKTLVTLLALVFVLGIAGTAFAAPANPFVDVPAKHWSYGAVAKLAKAGIVDGYGDGTFRGDRSMTRYEMAQVVAKAMAKSEKADAEMKALIDKLAVEFAAELNNLGVRVAKLEKNTGTIKFSGDARLRWVNEDKGKDNPAFAERFRLVGTAQVNDSTSFYFRDVVLNHNKMGNYGGGTNVISDVNLTHKNLIDNVDVMAGRYSLNLGQTTYMAGSTGLFDGVEFKWTAGKGNLRFGYADSNPVNLVAAGQGPSNFTNAGNIYYGEYNYAFSPSFKMNATYVKNQNSGNVDANKLVSIFGGGLTWNINSDWALIGDYWRNTADAAKAMNNGSAPKAMVIRLQNGTLKSTVPGSQMFFVEYLKAENGAIDGNWTGAMVKVHSTDKILDNYYWGIKAYDFQYSLTLAKNIVFDAIYQWDIKRTIDGQPGMSNGTGKTYTRFQINYMF